MLEAKPLTPLFIVYIGGVPEEPFTVRSYMQLPNFIFNLILNIGSAWWFHSAVICP